MTKKRTLLFALSCILSLGIGVVLGYGLQTQGLMGTAVLPVLSPSPPLDLQTAFMMLQMQRVERLEEQIKERIEAIQQRLEEITKISNALADVRRQEKDARAQQHREAEDAAKQSAEALQAALDTLQAEQQADMILLQSLTAKRNEAYDAMTNYIAKMQQTRSSIQENMR